MGLHLDPPPLRGPASPPHPKVSAVRSSSFVRIHKSGSRGAIPSVSVIVPVRLLEEVKVVIDHFHLLRNPVPERRKGHSFLLEDYAAEDRQQRLHELTHPTACVDISRHSAAGDPAMGLEKLVVAGVVHIHGQDSTRHSTPLSWVVDIPMHLIMTFISAVIKHWLIAKKGLT